MRRVPPAWLALLLLAGAHGASALEHAQEQLLWLEPHPAWVEAAPGRARPVPALLNLPPGWAVGDAAAILLADRRAEQPTLARLRATLLADGAAVLELEARPAPGGDCARAPLPLLVAGAAALRQELGAGLLVAVGFGCPGQAALHAAGGAVTQIGFEDGAAPLTAAVALEVGPPAFMAGMVPAPEEAWPVRAPILCRLFAAVLDVAEQAEVLRACLAALLPVARRE
jgi:hypothetical protein